MVGTTSSAAAAAAKPCYHTEETPKRLSQQSLKHFALHHFKPPVNPKTIGPSSHSTLDQSPGRHRADEQRQTRLRTHSRG